MKSVLLFCWNMVVGSATSLAQAGVLLLSWRWFVAPTFGIQAPSLTMCCGLLVTAGVVMLFPASSILAAVEKSKLAKSEHETFDRNVALLRLFIGLPITMLVAYVIHLLAGA